MPYPSKETLVDALHMYIASNGGSVHSSSTYKPLAILFGLSDEEQQRTRGEAYGGKRAEAVWHNKIQYARLVLKERQYLTSNAPRGIWRLSQLGEHQASHLLPKSPPASISLATSKASESADKVADEYLSHNTEETTADTFIEGATRAVVVNAHERNSKARQACIAHYGYKCVVCGFCFTKTYGAIGEKFIHVHHVRDLASIGCEYEVDPIADLRPVCPNCHAMLHVEKPAMEIEVLRAIVEGLRN